MMFRSEGYNTAFQSLEKYHIWRDNRANESLNHLELTYPVAGRNILDFGCGFGSLSEKLIERGANVFPVEIDAKRIAIAKQKLLGKAEPIQIGQEGLPFADNTFDAIISMDVLEHVNGEYVSRYLDEAFRTLKPNGIFYAEMTPYYSVTGHHLLQLTHLPVHLLLPKKWIKHIVDNSNQKSFKTNAEIWEQFNTLNKLRVPDLQKLLTMHKTEYEGFIFKFPGLFKLNLPFLGKLGVLGEALTLSYEALIRKA